MVSNENRIWLQVSLENGEITGVRIGDNSLSLNKRINIPEDLINKLRFLYQYSIVHGVNSEELIRLSQFVLDEDRPLDFQREETNSSNDVESSEPPMSIRRIVYDFIRTELEEIGEADLDGATSRIIELSEDKYSLNSDSVRASVSSTISALRNSFPEFVMKSWNEPVWRGKSTGRNPHIQVKERFEMPDYDILWDRYSKYLESRKRKK